MLGAAQLLVTSGRQALLAASGLRFGLAVLQKSRGRVLDSSQAE